MSDVAVRDYLQTQGLKLPVDEIVVAKVAAQAVMASKNAVVEHDVLWYANQEAVLAEHLPRNQDTESALKQVFMALDSAFERMDVQSAAVYALIRDEEAPYLLRLVQQGEVMEQLIRADEENGWFHLAARSAQTGWLNIADDVESWLEYGDLKGAHHLRCQSQISLPICLSDGRVLGVLHVEAAQKHGFDEAVQAACVGLVLALTEPLKVLLAVDEEHNGEV